jgi:hypothetical protein
LQSKSFRWQYCETLCLESQIYNWLVYLQGQSDNRPITSYKERFWYLPSARNRFVKLPSGPHFIDPAGPTIHRHSGNYNRNTTLWVAKIQLSKLQAMSERELFLVWVSFWARASASSSPSFALTQKLGSKTGQGGRTKDEQWHSLPFCFCLPSRHLAEEERWRGEGGAGARRIRHRVFGASVRLMSGDPQTPLSLPAPPLGERGQREHNQQYRPWEVEYIYYWEAKFTLPGYGQGNLLHFA